MKYWFYSEGNILGPYDPAEMLALPAFAEESLVCPETCTGDSPGDWRPASQVAEISSALSCGSGRAITSGVVAGAYEYETGFNSSASYFENREPSTGASYGELLDTIDNILGAYKEGPSAAAGKAAPETDYDLAEKFDIRLSHIQEELEAARWEKNLLLEKIRNKEMEEKKNRERIAELEARLKTELGRSYVSAQEFEQLRHLADLKEKAETVRQIEEIKREEKEAVKREEQEAIKRKEQEAIKRKEQEEIKRKEQEEAARKEDEELKKRILEDIKIKELEEIKREEEIQQAAASVQLPGPAAVLPPSQAVTPEPAKDKAFHALKPVTISELTAPEEKPAQEEKTAPESEVRAYKSITRGSSIKLETSLGKEFKEDDEDIGLASRKFKSLGQTQEPAYAYGSHYDKPLPGPESAPPGAYKAPEVFEPLPQQAGGVVYDFTVVTPKQADTFQQFQIETRYEAPAPQAQPAPVQPQPVKPPTFDFGLQQPAPAPAPAPAPVPAPTPAPVQPQSPQVQHGFQFQPFVVQPSAQPPTQPPAKTPAPVSQVKAPEPQSFSPSVQLPPAATPAPREKAAAAAPVPQEKTPAAAPDSPDVTMRIPVQSVKGKTETKPPEKAKKKGGRMAFIPILVIFGSMAAGGLGYFFMGEGVSFSEFSMISLGSKKKTDTLDGQLDGKTQPAPAPGKTEPAPEAQPAPKPQPVPVEKPANENIKKALEIVKGYKLSGGRGSMATWFANSFLSGSSGGANEEWTATPLHGDILVVQYRLLRPKQEPLIYQFEVDAAKRDIVRGINNNAIELLDFSSKEKSVSAAPVKKPAAKPKARKTSRPGSIPILPLPDAPPAGAQAEQDPTGFENAQAEGSEQVKYLKAQESDEELF